MVAIIAMTIIAGGLYAQPFDLARARVDEPLAVELWMNKPEGSVYYPGEPTSIYFRTNRDAYVTVYDIETDGRVRILFPDEYSDGYVHGGIIHRIPEPGRWYRLIASGPTGIEYIQAVATDDPGYVRYRRLNLRIRFGITVKGDPFLAMNGICERIVPERYGRVVATTWFFVGERVLYPRYLCYDCHYPPPTWFHPYVSVCPRYEVIVVHRGPYWWRDRWVPPFRLRLFASPFWKVVPREERRYRSEEIWQPSGGFEGIRNFGGFRESSTEGRWRSDQFNRGRRGTDHIRRGSDDGQDRSRLRERSRSDMDKSASSNRGYVPRRDTERGDRSQEISLPANRTGKLQRQAEKMGNSYGRKLSREPSPVYRGERSP